MPPDENRMKSKVIIAEICFALLLCFSGCAIYPNFVERIRNNGVVVDAWERGKRAEQRAEYQKAKEEYYFVKRFATTYYLQVHAQEHFEAVSRILEEQEKRD
jgi:hypothetical protein